MTLSKEDMYAAIERAKQLVADAKQRRAEKLAEEEAARLRALNLTAAVSLPHAPASSAISLAWNTEQQMAIDHGFFGKSFCLIGAAGTGKTTTLKAVLQTMLEANRLPPLEQDTKHLRAGAPGVALISYTRRAVRNIAKQMSAELKSHCLTFHSLVEYAPHFYETWDADAEEMTRTMRFEPDRNSVNPLPRNLRVIIVDEASMLSIDYMKQVWDALPNKSQVQFIFLGDLNQLPPVYGQAILGKMLLELPIIELTRVYRQALESPIIALALAVKDNNFTTFETNCKDGTFDVTYFDPATNAPTKQFLPINTRNIAQKITIEKAGRGKVTLQPWKKALDKDDACDRMMSQLNLWIKDGTYDPDLDLVLCPWNTSFGTDELNRSIANYQSQSRGLLVHEVISGYEKHYLAVGDKLLVEKMDAIVLRIERNYRYLGKVPQPASLTLNRWGNGGSGHAELDESLTDEQVDLMLEHAADVADRTAETSHSVVVRMVDTDEQVTITKAAILNASSFGYAITVHKAQGSECRRVFFITHQCHAAMCSRELVYTAITRAAEELHIVMAPKMLGSAASKPRIKGDTLAAKLEFFNSRMQEKSE